MQITIDMIEQVLDATDGDYCQIKQALVDADGDVDAAIAAVKAAQAEAREATEAVDATEATSQADDPDSTINTTETINGGSAQEDKKTADDNTADWTTDEFAEDMIERIKKRIREGNVDHLRITKGESTLIDIPVNVGIIGGLIGMLALPWAMIAGALAAYGMNCKVEIVTKDGGTEEL